MWEKIHLAELKGLKLLEDKPSKLKNFHTFDIYIILL